ncbi:MAG: hypothetical protein AUJ92_19825 [Armatimonadetes bacterium CG2_30_59_28]|nr:MAG: hypothetical protein AUJ92_19825 [Armatimonadetes bacterium CG2_30_59_28]PIU60525.1 MAG: hypothetical protein COS85_24125 [Armatimonadetes bacterium CG07_land_8_20_14_0_80_59_28]PIX43240.1 MAG: hypothetical protein COZ56_07575 [Armatimonadetes bacterium CG_4_8_14_3_um_filter_58_9]PJB62348.1 MAG: hypothetical protein CO095_18600 [Armatimonadetes bacterium CG_4_9_14_3_um_filter_58_7]
MSDPPTVAVVCGDPGGANAVLPVLQALRWHGVVRLQLFGYREACSIWEKRGWAHERLLDTTSVEDAQELLENATASFLLTGTSCNDVELEKRFIAAARELGTASLALLDFWSNYTRRFSDAEGNLSYLPNRIAVMDEVAREEMIAEGFPPSLLEITGQPAFDDLVWWRRNFSEMTGTAIRRQLGAGPEDLLVLFASQPLAELYGDDPAHPNYLGYTEESVVRMLVDALDSIATRDGRRVVLAVRPHPREPAGKYTEMKGERVAVVVSTNGEARAVALAADLVVGMNTELLVETCYLGCVTLSLQPGLRRPDMLPTNRSDYSRPVYAAEEIEAVTENLLLNEQTRAAMRKNLENLKTDGLATSRVVDLICQMVFSISTCDGMAH